MSKSLGIYGGRDPRDLAAYPIGEAAQYVGLPKCTIRSWCLGRKYPTEGGIAIFKPLIELADRKTLSLSFTNVVELYVLSAIRRRHQVNMARIRQAIDFMKRRLGTPHPLADVQMQTDGTDLFIQKYGSLVNISRSGQLEMRLLVDVFLRRIDRDAAGVPIRIYPYVRMPISGVNEVSSAPKYISMDPRIQFGRPCISGAGVPTAVIFERYQAGESSRALAKDYGQEIEAIEEAIRCEAARAGAA